MKYHMINMAYPSYVTSAKHLKECMRILTKIGFGIEPKLIELQHDVKIADLTIVQFMLIPARIQEKTE